jgi:hypothetical protein
MTTITAEHKAEWAEAREQALAAIERLNALCVATDRPYRYEWLRTVRIVPALDDDLDDGAADQDDGAPVDGYRPTYRPGGERAESEDESGEV